MSLQDYGITDFLNTRDPLIIALFEGCRYAFLYRFFILRYLNLTQCCEDQFHAIYIADIINYYQIFRIAVLKIGRAHV